MTDTKQASTVRDYWDRLCKLPKHSFFIVNGGIKRVADSAGKWVEYSEVQAIVDDAQARIAELEAQVAAVEAGHLLANLRDKPILDREAFERALVKHMPHAKLECHEGQYASPWTQAAWTGFNFAVAIAQEGGKS